MSATFPFPVVYLMLTDIRLAGASRAPGQWSKGWLSTGGGKGGHLCGRGRGGTEEEGLTKMLSLLPYAKNVYVTLSFGLGHYSCFLF